MQHEPKPIPGYPGYLIHPDGSIFKGRRRIKAHLSPSWRYKVRLRDAEGKVRQRDLAEVILETFKGPRPSPYHVALCKCGPDGSIGMAWWYLPEGTPKPPPPMEYPEGTPPDLAALLDELRASKRRVRVMYNYCIVPGLVRITQTVGEHPQLALSPGGRIDPRDITHIETPKGKVLYDAARH